MADDILRIEFTTEGTHISLNKESMNLALNSQEGYAQALSALSLLNIFVTVRDLIRK